jgi:hypothetical protein
MPATATASHAPALQAGAAPARPRQRRPAPVAWIPPADLDRAGWISAGTRLGELGRSSNWWVGDWLRYGTAQWGEKYVVAAKITGYDPHSLENMAYVASRFDDISLRREKLSWSHHCLVAALEPDKRTYWLDLAIERRMSVNDLRIELRAAQRLQAALDVNACSTDGEAAANIVVCPQCGFELGTDSSPVALDAGAARTQVGQRQ